jgi:peptidase E
MSLDEFALSLTGKRKPRVCYVPTASGDAAEYVQGFYDSLGSRCRPSHLPLFLAPFRPPADVLKDQDLIYVGGGSTPNLLAVWRTHGIDDLLRRAWTAGTVLYGSSAGGLCWFESGVTDSLGFDGELHPFTNGLGFLTGSHCPHLDTEPKRRLTYLALVQGGRLSGGYGVDEFAAVHFSEDEVHQTVASRAGAAGYRVQRTYADHPAVCALEVAPL